VNCPLCRHGTSHVLRTSSEDLRIARVRQCDGCGHRWNTEEIAAGTARKAREVLERVRELSSTVLP